MSLVKTLLGSVLSPLGAPFPFWAVKLRNQKGFLSELDVVKDTTHPLGERPFDWTKDLIKNGDIMKVEELWLFCPSHPANPLGNTARLPIVEPGTCFQFKVANLIGLTENIHSTESIIIGRVDNKETGECCAQIWDNFRQCLIVNYRGNVYDPPGFGSWHPRIAPVKSLSHLVVGLNLS